MAERIFFGKMKLIWRVDTRLPEPEYKEFIKNKGSKKNGQYLRELIIAHNNQKRIIRENSASEKNTDGLRASGSDHYPEKDGYRTISIRKTSEKNNEQFNNQ